MCVRERGRKGERDCVCVRERDLVLVRDGSIDVVVKRVEERESERKRQCE